MNIKTVTVLGANGTMGKNNSAIFASFGNAKVYMMCRSYSQASQAKVQAAQTVKADVIEKNLFPVTYDDIPHVIPESDLVFESVSEDFAVKEQVNNKVIGYLREDALFCTGTSGLSINRLSESMDINVAKRYFGMHLFNPPYSMPLCEVTPSEKTDLNIISEAVDYLKTILFRTVVVLKDKPAFLGNRIGFFFINEACQYAQKYKQHGGIDYIDTILGSFTGRNMPPLVTSDFVGLDVHAAITDNVYNNDIDISKESFIVPEYMRKLIGEGLLGKKAKGGFYKTIKKPDGSKTKQVYDILTGEYRDKNYYDITFINKMINDIKLGDYFSAFSEMTESSSSEAKIACDFLLRYVVYSLATSERIAGNYYAADDVMATGFNWIPPLAVIEAFGGKDNFIKLLKDCDMNNIDLSFGDTERLIRLAPKSNYDYRRFIKAKR